MVNKAGAAWLMEEVGEFLASSPSPEELLAFRPSARAMQRYIALSARSKSGSLSTEEAWELDQFEHLEILMQSIKARLRPAKPVRGVSDSIPAVLRAQVRDRAARRCEYCLLHEDDVWETHQPDHIIARKHRGLTELENLACTCSVCNRHKGSDLASIDEASGNIVRLFHPRRDSWKRHFRLVGGQIVPRTSVGRVTEFLLQLNRPDRVQVRDILHSKGLYPR